MNKSNPTKSKYKLPIVRILFDVVLIDSFAVLLNADFDYTLLRLSAQGIELTVGVTT